MRTELAAVALRLEMWECHPTKFLSNREDWGISIPVLFFCSGVPSRSMTLILSMVSCDIPAALASSLRVSTEFIFAEFCKVVPAWFPFLAT